MKTAIKSILAILFVVATALTANYLLPDTGVAYAVLIGTAAGGVGTPFLFQLDYLPEFIYWNDAAAPINQLIIETTEDGVNIDATAACIAAMRGYMYTGAQTANDQVVTCASGKIEGKRVTIRGTTSAVGAINFFASSDNLGGVAFKVKNLNVLANNPVEVSNFAALFLPNVVTLTDRVEVLYSDGLQQTYDAAELSALSAHNMQVPRVMLNNINSVIRKATINSVLGGAAYVLSYDIKIGS